MHRIAAAMLIAAAVLALNGSMLREAFAGDGSARPAPPAIDVSRPAGPRNATVLSLLIVLETLRQAPIALDPHKV